MYMILLAQPKCQSYSDSIDTHCLTFLSSSQGEGPYAPPPLPPYLESLPSPPAARDGGVEVFDTCYHLLQLYCSRDHSLELTLGPSASTPFQLDYRLRYEYCVRTCTYMKC